jgi:hypothetical protein
MSEVTSVNGQTGTVVLAATDVAAVATSEVGQPSGVASLNSSGELPEAQLPSSVVAGSLKELGNVSGTVKLNAAEARVFTATVTGTTEFEVINAPAGVQCPITLYVTQDSVGSHAWSVKGLVWIGSYTGSEPTFLTTAKLTYEVALTALGSSTLYGSAGLPGAEGPKGVEGAKGEKGEKGEAGSRGEAGAAGEGVEPELGIWLPIAFGQSVIPTTTAAIGTALRAFFFQIFLPKGAELNVIRIWNGATVNGNHNVALYSATPVGGEYELLGESGSVAAAGESAWQKVWEPKLATKAEGRRLFLAVMNSGTTHTFGILPERANAAAASLPEIPRLIGAHTFTELKYSKIKEANLEAAGKCLCIYGGTK